MISCYSLLNSRKRFLQERKRSKIQTRVTQVILEQNPMQPRINEKSRRIAAQSTDKETNRAGTMTQAQISKLLHQPSQKKMNKREEIRKKSLANEVKDCSFRPAINPDPRAKDP